MKKKDVSAPIVTLDLIHGVSIIDSFSKRDLRITRPTLRSIQSVKLKVLELPEPCRKDHSRFLNIVADIYLNPTSKAFIKVGKFAEKYFYFEIVARGNSKFIYINLDSFAENEGVVLPNPIEIDVVVESNISDSTEEENFRIYDIDSGIHIDCFARDGRPDSTSGVSLPKGPTP